MTETRAERSALGVLVGVATIATGVVLAVVWLGVAYLDLWALGYNVEVPWLEDGATLVSSYRAVYVASVPVAVVIALSSVVNLYHLGRYAMGRRVAARNRAPRVLASRLLVGVVALWAAYATVCLITWPPGSDDAIPEGFWRPPLPVPAVVTVFVGALAWAWWLRYSRRSRASIAAQRSAALGGEAPPPDASPAPATALETTKERRAFFYNRPALWILATTVFGASALSLSAAWLHIAAVRAAGGPTPLSDYSVDPYRDLWRTSYVTVSAALLGTGLALVAWLVSWVHGRSSGHAHRVLFSDAIGWTVQVTGVAAGAWLSFYAVEWRVDRGNAPGVFFDWSLLGENGWRWLVGPLVAWLALFVGFLLRKRGRGVPWSEAREGVRRGLWLTVAAIVLLFAAVALVFVAWGVAMTGWEF